MPTLTAPHSDPPPAVSDRTDRWLLRLADHLSTLEPAERVPFLLRQKEAWLRRYEAFAERVDSGRDPEFGEDAFDYLLTLAALDQRIAQERRS
jgi:hypothetical protein